MKINNKTASKKITAAMEAMSDLFTYLKSKEHNPDIISVRDVSDMYGKLWEANKRYIELESLNHQH